MKPAVSSLLALSLLTHSKLVAAGIVITPSFVADDYHLEFSGQEDRFLSRGTEGFFYGYGLDISYPLSPIISIGLSWSHSAGKGKAANNLLSSQGGRLIASGGKPAEVELEIERLGLNTRINFYRPQVWTPFLFIGLKQHHVEKSFQYRSEVLDLQWLAKSTFEETVVENFLDKEQAITAGIGFAWALGDIITLTGSLQHHFTDSAYGTLQLGIHGSP